jgi:hypothetical protein
MKIKSHLNIPLSPIKILKAKFQLNRSSLSHCNQVSLHLQYVICDLTVQGNGKCTFAQVQNGGSACTSSSDAHTFSLAMQANPIKRAQTVGKLLDIG